jgi:transketolase
LTAILDYNGLQQFGWQKSGERMLKPIEHPAQKWQAFGWHTIESDGHDISEITQAVAQAQTRRGKPTLIIANTIKGKGVSFMEDQYDWHARVPTQAELVQALAELGQSELLEAQPARG